MRRSVSSSPSLAARRGAASRPPLPSLSLSFRACIIFSGRRAVCSSFVRRGLRLPSWPVDCFTCSGESVCYSLAAASGEVKSLTASTTMTKATAAEAILSVTKHSAESREMYCKTGGLSGPLSQFKATFCAGIQRVSHSVCASDLDPYENGPRGA